MVENTYPGVYTTEEGFNPTIVGASTSTAAFFGTSRRGFADRLTLINSFREFVTNFGENYADSYLEDALYLFFQNGGRRAYVGRVLGAGAAASTGNLPSLAGAASAPLITSGNSEPFALASGDAISVSVDGGGAQTVTVTAARATRPGAGLAIVDLTGLTLLIAIDGGVVQQITFAGTEATAADVAQTINDQLDGGFASVNGAEVDISSDTEGTDSSVEITGGTALGEIGHSIGVTNGTGNVANVDQVSAAEIVALFVALPLAGATASDFSGAVRITHDTAGLASTLEVTAAAAAFGFPAGVVTGSDTTAVDLLQVDAINEGTWGDLLAVSTERWSYSTTSVLNTGGTSVTLDSVAQIELGDVAKIDDGTTSVLVHVHTIDVATKTITFDAVTLGAPIAIGATINTASSHRTRTSTSVAALAADTEITLTTAGQLVIGSEISIDDGTNLVFRRVTAINGNKVTLNGALSFDYAAGTLVVSQHFNLTLYFDSGFVKTFSYLTTQSQDERDWVELRLNGETTNESTDIEVTDLEPVIASAIEDRPAPVLNVRLSSGNNGALPIDNDYLGDVDPPTGLQLVNQTNPGEINMVAIPGITTLAVQQGLSDYCDQRQNLTALIEPPVTIETATEARDWRMNKHNRDSSYSAMYFPWMVIRDRHASSNNAQKNAPPSGIMAGVYARVDNEGKNPGPWVAPGNVPLIGVIKPVAEISQADQAILNPIGVNVLRADRGQGVRPWGVRTLAAIPDGRHYVNVRRLLNFVKISVSESLRGYIFAGIQPSLFLSMIEAITGFYRTIWKEGGLYPDDNFQDAYFVKIDSENNPVEARRNGQVFIDSGFNPPLPAEFINFRVGLYDGTAIIDEQVS